MVPETLHQPVHTPAHLYLFPVPFGECLNSGTAATCQGLLLLPYQQGRVLTTISAISS